MREAIDMLRRLAPPIRPTAGRTRRAVFEDRGFSDLLAGVAAGEITSQQPMADGRIDPDELTSEDLFRLTSAADQAASRGFGTAMMLLDGRGLVVDVENRTVVGQLGADDDDQSFDVDGALFVPGQAAPKVMVTLDAIAQPIPFAVAREIEHHRSESSQASNDSPQPRSKTG